MYDRLRRCSRPAAFGQVFFCCALLAAAPALAQPEPQPLRTFGYFQNAFQQTWDYQHDAKRNTFLTQQLNLFFQKDLGQRWTALVDFEVVNNFSSSQRWGSFNLEEAWLRYRAGARLNLKLGLHIPPFNNLNEIKNRTPLLPYITRPFVYESSLGEMIESDAFLPSRAFAQAYGFTSVSGVKLDYAVYGGNSPNLNADRERGQTGADTTNSILVGGRVGLRTGELKVGFSAARDAPALGPSVSELLHVAPGTYDHVERIRLGSDLSYTLGRLYLESELIHVFYRDVPPGLDEDLTFWYATLGVYATEQLFVYASFWSDREHARALDTRMRASVNIPTGGVSYVLNDMITLKAQYAYIDIHTGGPSLFPEAFSQFSTAVSVVF